MSSHKETRPRTRGRREPARSPHATADPADGLPAAPARHRSVPATRYVRRAILGVVALVALLVAGDPVLGAVQDVVAPPTVFLVGRVVDESGDSVPARVVVLDPAVDPHLWTGDDRTIVTVATTNAVGDFQTPRALRAALRYNALVIGERTETALIEGIAVPYGFARVDVGIVRVKQVAGTE